MTMKKGLDSATVFDRLRAILARHQPALAVLSDDEKNYTLITRQKDKKGKPIYFGSVLARKRYVSFHLMPVYCFPELLEGISGPVEADAGTSPWHRFGPKTGGSSRIYGEVDRPLALTGFRSRGDGLAGRRNLAPSLSRLGAE